jgi:histidine triad (HIT) family protein
VAEDCLFCKIAAGAIPSKRVYEDEETFAFHDIAPQAPVHFLVIPKRHVATLDDLEEGDGGLMGRLVLTARRLAGEQGLSEDGYRLVINCREGAGQSVFHIHLHVLGGRRMNWPPG